MPLPNLSPDDVARLIPSASDIQSVDQGGQKVVFRGKIDGQIYALKFMSPNPSQSLSSSTDSLDDVTARAQREVDTMQQCFTPHLVRMGPIGLTIGQVVGEDVLFFTEEFVEGDNLSEYLHINGPLSLDELVRLARHIAEAIQALWQFAKIHRDIKPGNIMRRSSNGDFVLLDMGLVFDLQDDSLSLGPVGTPRYFSPEQVDFQNRRAVMDFRSDLFSLGIVLYQMATNHHPFVDANTQTSWDVIRNIRQMKPTAPSSIRPDVPGELDEIILRLLGKRPALRYRSIELFQKALDQIPPGDVS